MIKDLLRIGSQFIGYREYANRAEEKFAEANERADALAQKLEQSEAARKKAELAASKAKVEADEAKAKAAGVEELQKKLEDATTALDELKAAQASRDEGILKRLKSQSRRTLTQTNQDFDLDNPVNDPLLDALSLLEFHGREIREGVANANAGLRKGDQNSHSTAYHEDAQNRGDAPVVGDPDKAETKGAPKQNKKYYKDKDTNQQTSKHGRILSHDERKKERLCTACNQPGHNRNNKMKAT
ncbi:uncharacterized protein [Lolium perenne]|uniref:uncharacterized protein n=1 Tax=Lolium perenne TaxID=4522 RepID=UPI003A9A00A8